MSDTVLYDTLEVSVESTHDEIKKAYRKLALRWHPDKNQNDPLAADKFKLIADAYGILSDPDQRSIYDKYGLNAVKRTAQMASQGGVPLPAWLISRMWQFLYGTLAIFIIFEYIFGVSLEWIVNGPILMGTLLFFGKRKLLAMTAVWAVASVLLYFLLPSAVQELLANMLTMVTLLAAINVVNLSLDFSALLLIAHLLFTIELRANITTWTFLAAPSIATSVVGLIVIGQLASEGLILQTLGANETFTLFPLISVAVWAATFIVDWFLAFVPWEWVASFVFFWYLFWPSRRLASWVPMAFVVAIGSLMYWLLPESALRWVASAEMYTIVLFVTWMIEAQAGKNKLPQLPSIRPYALFFLLHMLYELRYRQHFPTIWPVLGCFIAASNVWLLIFLLGALNELLEPEAERAAQANQTNQ